MLKTKTTFEKIGRILHPDKNVYWMSTFTGPTFALQKDNSSIFDLYLTG
ncbi:MAG: hypothetical protein HYZ79_01695, partial [Candidatus Melainabacteria bacterium]|nr:hypothetical protein [Candidatus Melainabacteria bacterium]